MEQITLNYDSNRHNENRQMTGVYSGVDDDGIYIIYIRSETRYFVDIVYTIDDNVIYEGKKKKNDWHGIDTEHIYIQNYKIFLIGSLEDNVNEYLNINDNNNNDNIIDNFNNCDAIKL